MEHMTTQEVAKYLKVSVSTIQRFVHEEGMPVLRFPGRRAWSFRKDLVDAWVYEQSKPKTYVNGEEINEVEHFNNKVRVMIPNS